MQQHSIEEISYFNVFIVSGRAPEGRFRSTVEPAKISWMFSFYFSALWKPGSGRQEETLPKRPLGASLKQ